MMNSPKPSRRRTWACLLAPFILLGSLLLGGWAGGQLCYRTLLATPTSLPAIPGTRQLTTDFVFYNHLSWSPSGKYLTSGRSDIIKGEVQSWSGSMVLIELKNNKTIPINFEKFTPYSVDFLTYAWSPDNDRLLLLVSENLPITTPDAQRRLKSSNFVFNVTDNSLQEIILPPLTEVVDWNHQNPDSLLVAQYTTQLVTYAWYTISNGRIQKIINEEKHQSAWLSEDGKKLLSLVRDPGGDCGDIYTLALNIPQGFTLLQSHTCGIAWSRDGSRMAYTSYANDPQQNYAHARLMLANGDGSNPQPFFADENLTGFYSVAWSPDGKQIAFSFMPSNRFNGYATGIYIADVPAKWQP